MRVGWARDDKAGNRLVRENVVQASDSRAGSCGQFLRGRRDGIDDESKLDERVRLGIGRMNSPDASGANDSDPVH